MSQTKKEQPKAKKQKSGKAWLSEVWWVPIVVALIGLIGILTPTFIEYIEKTPTPQLDSDFDYSFRVQDRETGEPIPNAQVTIEVIGQAPLDEVTDSNGFARIFVDTSRVGQPSRLIVQVAGYRRYTQNIDLKQDRLPDIVQLEPELSNTLIATPVSSVPTSESTPVSEPTPTATTQPAPILNCLAAAEPFTEIWATTQDTIGCASSSLATGLIAEESFYGGKMFWREPFDYSQAVIMFSDGTWQIFQHQPYDDTQESEFSCLDENTPAQCPPTPKRGFGMMWCDIPTIRDRLGNAIECERGYQGKMQQFEQGFMLQSDSGSIYIFYGYESGQWERR